MPIEDLYRADLRALSRVSRKLETIPDDVDSLKVLNAVAAELNSWIPRHADAESLEVLGIVTARLSPEAKPLPALLNDYKQILLQKDAAAADDAVGSIKFSFYDALDGLRAFIAGKGLDPAAFEDAPAAPPPPAVEVQRDEMLETTTVEGSEAAVQTEAMPELETNAVVAEPAAPEAPAAAPVYKCEFCGFAYETAPGKFCDNCGRALARFNLEAEEESVIKKCLKCGHRNGKEDRLCKNCGELLRDPEL